MGIEHHYRLGSAWHDCDNRWHQQFGLPDRLLQNAIKTIGTRLLKTPHRHRNITVKRVLLDAGQFLRAQSFVAKGFGRPFQPSRNYAEIDITYKCNLKCINCNRSCTQAPIDTEMPVAYSRYSRKGCNLPNQIKQPFNR